MSKTGQWVFDLEEKHYDGKCEEQCHFCKYEPETRGIRT